MGRARCRYTCSDVNGKRLSGASVHVYEPNSTTPIAETLYADYTGVETLANPLETDVNGAVLFYLDAPKRVDLRVVATGYADLTVPDVPVLPDAEQIALKAEGAPVVMVAVDIDDSPYTVPGWGYHVDVDATDGPVTVTLPSAVDNAGQLIEVRKTDSSANTVTVDANGAETINGEATLVIYAQYDSYSLRSDGTNVEIV